MFPALVDNINKEHSDDDYELEETPALKSSDVAAHLKVKSSAPSFVFHQVLGSVKLRVGGRDPKGRQIWTNLGSLQPPRSSRRRHAQPEDHKRKGRCFSGRTAQHLSRRCPHRRQHPRSWVSIGYLSSIYQNDHGSNPCSLRVSKRDFDMLCPLMSMDGCL